MSPLIFLRPFFRAACACALLLAAAGCVTSGDAGHQQQLEIHTILDHREVTGVGCVLSNSAGRWFVLAPGRVTVERTRDPLTVDCARAGTGSAQESVAARAGSRIDVNKLIGNLILDTALDSYYNQRSGAGVAYPSVVTVLMRAPDGARGAAEPGNDGGMF